MYLWLFARKLDFQFHARVSAIPVIKIQHSSQYAVFDLIMIYSHKPNDSSNFIRIKLFIAILILQPN